MSQFTEHAGRLKADLVNADSLVVGSQGTDAGGAWTQVTATLVGGSLGVNSERENRMRYMVVGKTCHWSLLLRQTTAGVQSADLQVPLPVRAKSTDTFNLDVAGYGQLLTTNGDFVVIAGIVDSTDAYFRVVNAGTINVIGTGTAALDDNASWQLAVAGCYEIA
jgi:hypothetical protein